VTATIAVDSAVAGGLHVDMMDGRTLSQISGGPLIVSAIRLYYYQDFTDVPFVTEPERYVAFCEAQFECITVHAEHTACPLAS
jgi:ribulose-phosphate 3-epimerase